MPVTLHSSRFGTLEIADGSVLSFPEGLIGLGGPRWALLHGEDEGGAFSWLHSLDDGELALPITRPEQFYPDYAVELSEEEAARIGITDPAATEVWVTVRAAPAIEDFTLNLAAPILIADGRGHQVLNEAPGAELRAPLVLPGA